MKGLLMILGVCLALLAMFTPTATASTIDECNTTMSLDCLDSAVAIRADDSGGSLFAELQQARGELKYQSENYNLLDAKHEATIIDDLAIWYPGKYLRARRASARAGGGWYPGKNVGRVLFGRGSC